MDSQENNKTNVEKRKEVIYLEVEKIMVPTVRVTSVFDPDILTELEESIKVNGIKVPLTIAKYNNQYVLIDGLHRLMVAKKLGIKKVPCLVEEMDMDQILLENIIRARQRGKTNPADEAEVIKTLVEEYHYSLEEAAKRLGMGKMTAYRLYEISKLPDEVKSYLRAGRLGVTKAYMLTRLPSKEKQIELARLAVTWDYNIDQMRAAVIQELQGEYTPEPGGWTINPESGQPERVPILCELCGKEITDKGIYIWLHPECLAIIKQFITEWKNLQQQTTTTQQPPPTTTEKQPTSTKVEKPKTYWPYQL